MILTRRPLLEQELVRVRLEALVRSREGLAELMEETPSLKVDTEPFRSPKAKRVKPKPSPVRVYQLADDLELAA